MPSKNFRPLSPPAAMLSPSSRGASLPLATRGIEVVMVGQTNVGKSTLMNRLSGRRLALTHATPGVTRDWKSVEVVIAGRTFQLTDTPGLLEQPRSLPPVRGASPAVSPNKVAQRKSKHAQQVVTDAADASTVDRSARLVMERVQKASLVLLVGDAASGVTAGDYEIIEWLRGIVGNTMVVVVNKAEGKRQHEALAEFSMLGAADLVVVSALHGDGVDALVDIILERCDAANALPLETGNDGEADSSETAPIESRALSIDGDGDFRGDNDPDDQADHETALSGDNDPVGAADHEAALSGDNDPDDAADHEADLSGDSDPDGAADRETDLSGDSDPDRDRLATTGTDTALDRVGQGEGISPQVTPAKQGEKQPTDEEATENEWSRTPPSLCVIGRPNAGKSTLINQMIGDERMLTGPEAGLTHDSMQIPFAWNGNPYTLVDTAGLRRQARIETETEKLYVSDSLHSVRYAHVVLLLIDATSQAARQDLRLARRVLDEGRALVIALNKGDIAQPAALRALQEEVGAFPFVPCLVISAIEGRGLRHLMDTMVDAYANWQRRISTARLNEALAEWLILHPPPMAQGRRNRMRYITQVATRPPRFAIWTSRPEAVPESYRRYLENNIRGMAEYKGTPVRIAFRRGKNPYVAKGS
ncbi:MAG: 50S ribosome-binding GTPase [Alphaproteobacteria bacterium]|nr:50S ribosome-binding GTPase [Alphaproteobacteria bacterium]